MSTTGSDQGGRGQEREAEARDATRLEERLERLEQRIDRLLSGQVDLEIVDIEQVSVAPRSKLRVSCE